MVHLMLRLLNDLVAAALKASFGRCPLSGDFNLCDVTRMLFVFLSNPLEGVTLLRDCVASLALQTSLGRNVCFLSFP